MFGILRKRRDPETAELRDRAIKAESRVLLLEDRTIAAETACVSLVNELDMLRRPKREKRRDSAEYQCDRHGTTARGERHWGARLNEDDVRSIRSRRKAGEGLAVIASSHGVSRSTVGYIISGKLWAHVR